MRPTSSSAIRRTTPHVLLEPLVDMPDCGRVETNVAVIVFICTGGNGFARLNHVRRSYPGSGSGKAQLVSGSIQYSVYFFFSPTEHTRLDHCFGTSRNEILRTYLPYHRESGQFFSIPRKVASCSRRTSSCKKSLAMSHQSIQFRTSVRFTNKTFAYCSSVSWNAIQSKRRANRSVLSPLARSDAVQPQSWREKRILHQGFIGCTRLLLPLQRSLRARSVSELWMARLGWQWLPRSHAGHATCR
ncbi:hypothetical protein DFH11DRAFT_1213947 [Phellopilus nigrolimitatus]|nr:hypothetical protein DFH11DRAFT_1213947 [Phellopilus nigrolimitatus]